jgi:hypothetical protein
MTRVNIGLVVKKNFGAPDSKTAKRESLSFKNENVRPIANTESHKKFVRNLFASVSS